MLIRPVTLAPVLLALPLTALAIPAGKILFASGPVAVIPSSGAQSAAGRGTALHEGDTLATGPDATAQVRMADGGMVALRPDTVLKITRFQYAGRQDGSERVHYSLTRGSFLATTGKIGEKNRDNYRISTPVATIGIRGTTHITAYIPPGQARPAEGLPAGAYNQTLSGMTFVRTEAGVVDVRPGEAVFVDRPTSVPAYIPNLPPALAAARTAEAAPPPGETAPDPAPATEPAAPAPEAAAPIIIQPVMTVNNQPVTREELLASGPSVMVFAGLPGGAAFGVQGHGTVAASLGSPDAVGDRPLVSAMNLPRGAGTMTATRLTLEEKVGAAPGWDPRVYWGRWDGATVSCTVPCDSSNLTVTLSHPIHYAYARDGLTLVLPTSASASYSLVPNFDTSSTGKSAWQHDNALPGRVTQATANVNFNSRAVGFNVTVQVPDGLNDTLIWRASTVGQLQPGQAGLPGSGSVFLLQDPGAGSVTLEKLISGVSTGELPRFNDEVKVHGALVGKGHEGMITSFTFRSTPSTSPGPAIDVTGIAALGKD